MYDEALLTVPSQTGIKLLIYLKDKCNTSDYTIFLKIKELAKIFECNDRALRNNLKNCYRKNF